MKVQFDFFPKLTRNKVHTFFSACLVIPLLSGCSTGTSSRNGEMLTPRETIGSPATSTVGRNFEAARLEKLAVIVEANPGATAVPVGGYDWQGDFATGGWVPRTQINAQSAIVARFV